MYEAPELTQLIPAGVTCIGAVSLEGAHRLEVLEELAALGELHELTLTGGGTRSLAAEVFASPVLRSVMIRDAASLTSIAALTGSPALENVFIQGAAALQNMDALATLPALRWLFLQSNAELESLPVFELMDGARGTIVVRDNPKLAHGPEFPLLESLGEDSSPYRQDASRADGASLEVRGNPLLTSIGAFPLLRELPTLAVSGTQGVTELSLPSLASVQYVELRANESLTAVDLLSIEGTSSLFLMDNPVLNQVALAPGRVELSYLDLRNNPALSGPALDLLFSSVAADGDLYVDGSLRSPLGEPER